MPDQATAVQPQVALIYGDDGAAQHLRDALAGHVAIVYDAQAAAFDADRLVAAGARAALVNLDSYDWLDTLTAQLGKAGVAVVFNDPETSAQLEGWEHARWLRHLVAKLRGSEDYDPPRPVFGVEPAATTAALAPTVPAAQPGQAGDQPLSPRPAEVLDAAVSGAVATPDRAPVATPVVPLPAAFDVAAAVDTPPAEEAVAAQPPHLVTAPSAVDDFDPALDVDTEALSAMIDARLAEPEAPVQPVIAAGLSVVDSAPATDAAGPAVPAAEPEPPAVTPAPTPQDDADMLANLPALGDWALVDPEAPIASTPKAAQHTEPALTDSLAGIELVPMDNDVPNTRHMEPVEHRLYGEARKQADAADDKAAGGVNGDHA